MVVLETRFQIPHLAQVLKFTNLLPVLALSLGKQKWLLGTKAPSCRPRHNRLQRLAPKAFGKLQLFCKRGKPEHGPFYLFQLNIWCLLVAVLALPETLEILAMVVVAQAVY
jgi:hypothetical protein